MEKMREIVFCIVVAFSLTTHPAMAEPPDYGYAGFSGRRYIVGRDGLCLDILKQSCKRHTPTQLSPCESMKQSQLWTALEDSSIRFFINKYCLVPYNNTIGATVIIGKCNKGRRIDKVWHLKDGTMVHVASGLVLTAKSDGYVALEINENAPSQSWEANEGLSPTVANIKWLENLCLQSTEGDNSYVLLNECSRENKNQRWALYGDGTIRKNDNRNYCLTSSDRDASSLVIVSKCGDKPQQRWGFNAEDNTINHPSTNLVMDVKRKIELLPQIIVVDKRDGTPSQRWTIF